jgi:hypothetical protein
MLAPVRGLTSKSGSYAAGGGITRHFVRGRRGLGREDSPQPWLPATRGEKCAFVGTGTPRPVLQLVPRGRINEKQTRSIKYQLTIVRGARRTRRWSMISLAEASSPSNAMPFSWAQPARQNPCVYHDGRKLHPSGARGRFDNVVDLIDRPEIESSNARQGRIAEHLTPDGVHGNTAI